MQKKKLLKTNFYICIILIIGFILVSIVGYCSNTGMRKIDMEHVSALTSESIYYQIESFFSEPVNVSLTMANDTLLKRFLAEEDKRMNEQEYLKQLQDYLNAYKEQYHYDSVFLVSAHTGRYYHFNGLNRILEPGNPENIWYFTFLEENDEYSLNVDNDEAAKNDITVFVNCKIEDNDGTVIGVVGVGMRIQNLQQLLQSYDRQYNIKAMLVNEAGILQLSSEASGESRIKLFDNPSYAKDAAKILESRTEKNTFWHETESSERFIVAKYVPTLGWHLIIENNTEEIQKQFERQFMIGLLITVVIIAIILYLINHIIISYNDKLIKLTMSQEMEYRDLLQEATKGLYENVFEMDITNDCASGEGTKKYFKSLGISGNTPYHRAIKVIAKKQIKAEFVEGYLKTFAPRHVLDSFEKGITELYYDFMIKKEGGGYRWMRIRARIFYWESNQSIRMITYRQDITKEKEREEQMLQMAQRDALTDLYNKNAIKEYTTEILQKGNKNQSHALIMLDIDYFKSINDKYGHAAGDKIIQEFAKRLGGYFRSTDICGRMGGDEFAAFIINIPDMEWLKKQLKQLSACLREEILLEEGSCCISASIGAAVYPRSGKDFEELYRNADAALYQSKEKGRNCFTIFEEGNLSQ